MVFKDVGSTHIMLADAIVTGSSLSTNISLSPEEEGIGSNVSVKINGADGCEALIQANFRDSVTSNSPHADVINFGPEEGGARFKKDDAVDNVSI